MNTKPPQRAVYGYQLLLFALAAWFGTIASRHGLGNPFTVAGLAATVALAERGRVQLSRLTQASISVLPTVFAAAVLGPQAAMVVGAASFIGDFPPFAWITGLRALDGESYLKWGVYTCTRAIYGAAAGFAADTARSALGGTVEGLVVATVAAALVAESLDVVLAAITLKLRGGRMRPFLLMSSPIAFAAVSLYVPVVALLAVAYREVSPWTIALFFVPALAAQRLFGLYEQQRSLADDLGEANRRLEAANLSFATALVATLDARDCYTAGHSAAVAIYAEDIAARMELSAEERQLSYLCGLVHDIGKIGLPAGLLEKPGALTLEERREMQRHSEIGERILANVPTYREIAAVVRHHHERIDGGGYPDGLIADEIPVLSRIIAVADAYNAMTSDRPYRDAMPSSIARLRLAQAVGTQFDTAVVAAFEAVLAAANEQYRAGMGARFVRLDSPKTPIRASRELEMVY